MSKYAIIYANHGKKHALVVKGNFEKTSDVNEYIVDTGLGNVLTVIEVKEVEIYVNNQVIKGDIQ